jgi:hypothetical protein
MRLIRSFSKVEEVELLARTLLGADAVLLRRRSEPRGPESYPLDSRS